MLYCSSVRSCEFTSLRRIPILLKNLHCEKLILMTEMLSYFGEFGSVVQLDSMWEDSIPFTQLGPALILVLKEGGTAKCIALCCGRGLDLTMEESLGRPLPAYEHSALVVRRVNMDTKPGSHLRVI